jgi:2-polyprenyl-3-methyl-5-hydroxy-6-metoxy-1,4-benzoquinol methylase
MKALLMPDLEKIKKIFSNPILPDEIKTEEGYISYEEYFRGSDEAKNGRIEEHKDLFAFVTSELGRQPETWLDIGCGSGLLLDVLRQEGLTPFGIEIDAPLVVECRSRDHYVMQGEAIASMSMMRGTEVSFDVITILHVIEHLDPAQAMSLIEGCVETLSPGGMLVVVTPNAKDMRVISGSFFRDPTHVRPYPAQLLQFLLEARGLTDLKALEFERFTVREDIQRIPSPNGPKRILRQMRKLSQDLADGKLPVAHDKGEQTTLPPPNVRQQELTALATGLTQLADHVFRMSTIWETFLKGRNVMVAGRRPPLPGSQPSEQESPGTPAPAGEAPDDGTAQPAASSDESGRMAQNT